MRSVVKLLAISFIVLSVYAALSHATQILHQGPRQLGQESTVVVQGKVSGTYSYWNETRTKIFTETIITVDATHKGDESSTIRVLQLGGVVDNVRVTVHGALQWRPEEEVLLFLEPCTPGTHQVSGFSQGKFNIERDSKGRAYVKRAALEGVEIVGPSATSSSQRGKVERVPLDSFLNDALGDGVKGGAR